MLCSYSVWNFVIIIIFQYVCDMHAVCAVGEFGVVYRAILLKKARNEQTRICCSGENNVKYIKLFVLENIVFFFLCFFS